MIAYEEAVTLWALKQRPDLADRTITSVEVKHSESYQDDQTFWEAETIVTLRTMKLGTKGQKHYKSFSIYADTTDPLEFAQQLFAVAAEQEA